MEAEIITPDSPKAVSLVKSNAPTNRQRWLYSLANLGNTIPYNMINYLLFFYVDLNGLPVAMASGVMVGYAIWDSINNPLVGFLSDKTRTRWGRRIPYMLFGVFPYALFFVLIWMPPFDGESQPLQLLAFLILITFTWEFLGTLISTAYFSLLPEMFQGYRDRLNAAMSMNLMQIIGLVIGLALTPLLADLLGWTGTGLLFGGIILAAYYIGLTGMFERPVVSRAEPLNFRESLRATVVNRSFITAVMAQTFRFVSGNVLTTGVLFYVTYSLGVPERYGSLIMGVAMGAAALTLKAWRIHIAERYDARTTLMLANLVMGISAFPLAFAQSPWHAALAAVGLGTGLAGLILMGDVIMADVIDEDELRTGHRREGVYFGMSKLVMKMSTSIAALTFAFVTAAFGYDPSLAIQPETVDLGFRVYIAAPVAVSSVLAIIFLYFYPLHGERLRTLKHSISILRSH